MLKFSNCLRTYVFNRLVYQVSDYDSNPEYKKLQETVKKAAEPEKWTEGVDAARGEINMRCDHAVLSYTLKCQDEKRKQTEKIISDYENKESAEAAKIKQELTEKHKSNDKNKWKGEYDKLWLERVKPIQNQKYAERDRILKTTLDNIEAAQAHMQSLRDTAILQMRAAFAAREKVKKQIQAKIAARLKEQTETDPDTRQELKNRARFAADLADDSTLSSWKGEVNDYLDSSIGGRELKDSEIEDIIMGLVSALHDPARKDDPENPARKFMAGLSSKESASGDKWSMDDLGVRINDVQMQVLENLGYKAGNREEREDAKESDAGKLIADIAADTKLPPQLRGMLLGQLATGDEKNRDEMVKRVEWMYDTVKEGPKMEGGGVSGGTIATDIVGGILNLAWGSGIIAHNLASEWRDENALERAGTIFVALQDMVHIKNFNEVAAPYQLFASATGQRSEQADKIIEEATTPGAMRRSLPALKKATAGLENEYFIDTIAALTKDNEYVKVKDMYTAYGIPFNFDNDVEKLVKSYGNISISEFMASIAEMRERIKSLSSSPELINKALETRDAVNEKIAVVQEYQKKRNANANKPGVQAVPEITTGYTAITAESPEEILVAINAIAGALTADNEIAVGNKTALEQAIASVRSRGGGGGGEAVARTEPSAPEGQGHPEMATNDSPKARYEALRNSNKKLAIKIGVATINLAKPEEISKKINKVLSENTAGARLDGQYLTRAGVLLEFKKGAEVSVAGYTKKAHEKLLDADKNKFKVVNDDGKKIDNA